MQPNTHWCLWFSKRGNLEGIAIVHRASDYGLKLQPNGLSEADRIAWCQQLCDTLNREKNMRGCRICGGAVDLSEAVKPSVHVGVGRPPVTVKR